MTLSRRQALEYLEEEAHCLANHANALSYATLPDGGGAPELVPIAQDLHAVVARLRAAIQAMRAASIQ